MATTTSTSQLELDGTSPRIVSVTMPSNESVDWSTNVTGTGKPADNATKNTVTVSGTAPSSPTNGDIWLDTSTNPDTLKLRVGGAWQTAVSQVTNTNELVDGANLGGTATWAGVTGTGKPADNATKNTVTRSGTTPSSPTDGDLWADTSTTPDTLKVRVSGAWQIAANLAANTNELVDGAALGTTATWSGVTGTGKPADNATKNTVTVSGTAPSSPTNGDIWLDTAATPDTLKLRVGGAWQVAANQVQNTNELVDGANLGGTAVWSSITGQGTAGAPAATISKTNNSSATVSAMTISSAGRGISVTSSNSGALAGRFENSGAGMVALLCGTSYSVYSGSGEGKHYAVDGLGPFTGFHPGLLLRSEPWQLGDIVVDLSVISAADVSNVVTEVALSNLPLQRTAIGVISRATPIDERLQLELWWEFVEWADTHLLLEINGVGEGQVNVCGEGGDIHPGDLICTSSTPGKGMRQADDVIRSCTVARARAPAVFSTDTPVRMIPCVYLCG